MADHQSRQDGSDVELCSARLAVKNKGNKKLLDISKQNYNSTGCNFASGGSEGSMSQNECDVVGNDEGDVIVHELLI